MIDRLPFSQHELKLYGTAATISAFLGGLSGGIIGSVQGAPLGRSIAKPAGLLSFYTFSILTFRKMAAEARHKDDWQNGAIAGAWTGLFFGRALSGERGGMGIRPWLRATPGAFYSALLAIGIEQLIYLTFKDHDQSINMLPKVELVEKPTFHIEDWWPRWMPAHPDATRKISELTQKLQDLKEEVKDLANK